MIDSSTQPFGALCEYAKREPGTVRQLFRGLLTDDDGDLRKRQFKIDTFLAGTDELLRKYYPNSYMFVNTQQSAMAYLWFCDPDTHYYYKATEAKYLADCVEFYDNWGVNGNFHLSVYHRFCDEIVAQMRNNPALVETHQSRFDKCGSEMHPDEQLHILVVDMIFCARRYGLYDGIPIKDASAPARKLYHERKEKAAELLADLERAEQNAGMLAEARAVFLNMMQSGATIWHKAYGAAELKSVNNEFCTLFFPEKNEEKRFEILPALTGGFVRIDSPEFDVLLEKYRQVMRGARVIEGQLELAHKALEPYKEYLD